MIRENKMKGFTLVELLAVIVILAIILVIAVPKVMSVIEDSKKATLESTAKMIASAAEKAKVQNTVLGKTDDITCDSVAKINNLDYANCSIEFDDNNAKVTIAGKGKFEGLYVCNGTKIDATATSEECGSLDTLVSYIQALYNDDAESNGLIKDNTEDQNIRYSGGNDVVKNYIEFGNAGELWRIIGIFEVETENGTEEVVKIVREDSIGNIAWDTSDSTINKGLGINQWGESGSYEGADLMQLLNGKYLNRQNAENTCYNYETEEYETCNFSGIGMSSAYKDMIETVVWNTGAIDTNDTTIVDLTTMSVSTTGWYNAERGTLGKTCSATNSEGNANIYCNDTVARTSEWEGLVALPYATDWGYASSEIGCNTNIATGFNDIEGSTFCKNNNWMHYGTSSENLDETTFLLTPDADKERADLVYIIIGGGIVASDNVKDAFRVRPTLYLKANSILYGGDGSRFKPYSLVEKDDYTVLDSCFIFDEENGQITGYDISCGTDVVIPQKIHGVNVVSIYTRAFYENGITSVKFPEGLIEIGYASFYGNNISKVEIPNSVQLVHTQAFDQNPLTYVKLNNENTTVNCQAFGTQEIENNNLPNNPYLYFCPPQ